MALLRKMKVKFQTSLKGKIEGVCSGIAFGWAINRANPEHPPRVEILLDEHVIGVVDAIRYRPDNRSAAPSGYRCGFTFDLRPYLPELKGQRLAVRDAATGEKFGGEPLLLQRTSGTGRLDCIEGLDVCGWAVSVDPSAQQAEVEMLIDGEVAGVALTDQTRPDLKQAGVPRLRTGFRYAIPARWLDGKTHVVTARLRGSTQELSGRHLQFRAEVVGRVEVFQRDRIGGWIINLYDPDTPVRFDIWINGERAKGPFAPSIRRVDVENAVLKKESPKALVGFEIPFPNDVEWKKGRNDITLSLPGHSSNLLGKTLYAFDKSDVIRRLEAFAVEMVAESEAGEEVDVALSRILRAQIATAIASLRAGSLSQPALSEIQTKGPRSEPVDVIVPVYKGYQETLDCIRSVIATREETPMELIVINDQSPDAKLTQELRKMATKEAFTLIENVKNQGFVATVNAGMRLHSERDIVLLNSDTVVPRGWLAGLRRAAYAQPAIATVTPMSNRATIFSLPRTCIDNDMPLDLDVDQLNRLCAEQNEGVIVDVPTAMGFCMFIRRAALDEVGFFDEQRWAKGYAEENDFSVRAAAMGWRNAAACDVFVQHLGSVSFGADKSPRVQENLAKLNALYPDYPERVDRFIKTDPLAIPRARVNMALLKRLAPSWILFVTHGLGGGTETAIRNLCKQHAKSGRYVLIMRAAANGRIELAPAIEEHEKTIVTEYPHGTDVEIMAAHLRQLSIEYAHFHHSLGFRPDIWRLPELLGVPFDVMMHDFYLMCPRITMIDETGIYCGQPNITACERCVRANRLDHNVKERLDEVGGTVAAWRTFHAEQLHRARHVVAPSKDAVRRIRHYLPEQAVDAIPHPEPEFAFNRREHNGVLPYKVAVIGAIGPHKGVDLLLACAKYSLRENLPLTFVVVGYTSCDDAFAELENVEITGKYEPNDLARLVDETGCTVALFLSVWPETYSYTLSEAWRCGLVPVALDIGAQAERILDYGVGLVVPFPANPQSITSALIDAGSQEAKMVGMAHEC